MEIKNLEKKYKKAKVHGTSMTPAVQAGDIVYYYKSNHNKYKLAEVIVFKVKEAFVIHRIIRIKKNKIWAKGDNELFTDPVVNVEKILGKVLFIQRKKDIYDFSTRVASLYNYYCLIYSHIMSLWLRVSMWFLRNAFRGRRFFLRYLKDNR